MTTPCYSAIEPAELRTIEFVVTKENVHAIPSDVTHLTITERLKKRLRVGMIPNSITHLTFKYKQYLLNLMVGVIPNSVTHLTFYGRFYPSLSVGVIPNSVTHLNFPRFFNQPLDVGVIPNSVTHLSFGSQFNQPFDVGVIPNSVIHLTFERGFRYLSSCMKYSRNVYEIIVEDSFNSFTTYTYFHTWSFHEELMKHVFHPSRLQKICETYQLDLDELLEIYHDG